MDETEEIVEKPVEKSSSLEECWGYLQGKNLASAEKKELAARLLAEEEAEETSEEMLENDIPE